VNETIPPITGNTPQPKTTALALWSLALAIISLLFFLLIFVSPLLAIAGVICGHIAYSRIKHSSGALAGQGVALAGLIIGYASIGFSILFTSTLIFAQGKMHDTYMHNCCVNNLRMIDAAKQEWALEGGEKPGDVPMAQDLKPYLKNGVFPTCPAGGTYTIGAVSNAPTCSIPKHKLPQ